MAIGLGVVGLGWWGRELARATAALSAEFVIEACTSISAEERQAFSDDFGCVGTENYDALLKLDSVEAVLLATPHSLHAGQIEAAAKAGKHVFVEKPFTLSVESGHRAAAACEGAGVVLAVGHNRRLSGGALALSKLRDQGAFGTLLHLEAHFSSNSAMKYAPDGWRAQRTEAPGGALTSMGLHMVDTMQWLFGPIQKVSCLFQRRALHVDIDDTTVAILVFENGLTATLTSLFASPLEAWLRVCSTGGVFEAWDDFSALSHRNPEGAVSDIPVQPVDTVVVQLQAFAQAIRGDGPVAVSATEALRNIAVLEAMVASAGLDGAWTQVVQID
jgi:predicted dehydrogenase